MDKKSFFRGFGIGILFTAIIMGTSFVVRTSDSSIVSRAKKLGLVYAEELTDEQLFNDEKKPDVTSQPDSNEDKKTSEDDVTSKEKTSNNDTAEKTSSAENNADESSGNTISKNTANADSKKDENSDKKGTKTTSSEKNSDTKKNSESNSEKMKKEKEKMEKSIRNEKKTLTINAGEWSKVVSSKLQSMGIIDNAKAFDKFLDDNGYSSNIAAGTYSVSLDDTYTDLARKITKMQ